MLPTKVNNQWRLGLATILSATMTPHELQRWREAVAEANDVKETN